MEVRAIRLLFVTFVYSNGALVSDTRSGSPAGAHPRADGAGQRNRIRGAEPNCAPTWRRRWPRPALRAWTSQQALARSRPALALERGRPELQAAHAGWGTADAVIAAGLPVLCAPWSCAGWLLPLTARPWAGRRLLNRPSFWVVALLMLLVPLLKFGRWRYAVAGWLIFWALTVVYRHLARAALVRGAGSS